MEPLLQTVSQTVVHDVRALVHASQLLDAPALDELEPPGFQWHWHLPLGFVSLAAAGALLIAAGGLVLGAVLWMRNRAAFLASRPVGSVVQTVSD